MRIPLPELLITAILAAAFAAAGEVLTRRPARSLETANEAMLVGMAAAAGALFPLTLLLRRQALAAEAALLGAALVAAAAARFRARGAVSPAAPARTPDPIARLLIALVGLVVAAFAALNFRLTYVWDGFLIWATKAQLLSHSGALTREWYPGDLYDLRHLAYPPLVPLFDSLVGLLRGGFEFDVTKPIFFVFYLSMLVGTYSTVRSAAPARASAVAALLVALVPALSSGPAAGGYADMPQAALVAGVAAAAMSGRRDSLAWLIGGLTTVKSEGTILAALAAAAVAAWVFLERRRAASRPIAGAGPGIAIVAAFFVLRFLFVRWVGPTHEVYSQTFSAALDRIPRVARLCAAELIDPPQWGLFWPGLLLASALLLMTGANRERALAASVPAGLFLMAVPFLFTSWPLEVQVSQAYSRLASQLAPAAAVVLVLGYRTARDRIEKMRVLG